MENFPFRTETYTLIGICMEVHRILGHGFLEIVYKDAIEHELVQRRLSYCREKQYLVPYKDIILPHNFSADFLVFHNIILEVKATEGGISNEFVARTLNYLKASHCKIGLIVNFGRSKLEHQRLIF